jgi:hypothetical protein
LDELRALHEAGCTLPWVLIGRAPTGERVATGVAYEGHENAARMPFLCDFLTQRVLPFVDQDVNVNGAYRVELHDSYSYLTPRPAGTYRDALTFARPGGVMDRMALLPDPYMMSDYGGMMGVRDTVPWEAKAPTLFFAGTTTGHRDPARNERIRACVWSLAHRDAARFNITHVAQMRTEDAVAAVPRFPEVLAPHVPHTDHFRHRYQVNIVGNTACWSRLPMIMGSGSLLVHMAHADTMWYYPMLQEGVHFLRVDGVGAGGLDALLPLRERCEADPEGCKRIVANANQFQAAVLNDVNAALYTAHLLEAVAHWGRA